jgi:heme A synthase
VSLLALGVALAQIGLGIATLVQAVPLGLAAAHQAVAVGLFGLCVLLSQMMGRRNGYGTAQETA